MADGVPGQTLEHAVKLAEWAQRLNTGRAIIQFLPVGEDPAQEANLKTRPATPTVVL